MTATGFDRAYHIGARVRVVEGTHAGRVGTLLTVGCMSGDIVHIELDSRPPNPRGAFVRVRLRNVTPVKEVP